MKQTPSHYYFSILDGGIVVAPPRSVEALRRAGIRVETDPSLVARKKTGKSSMEGIEMMNKKNRHKRRVQR